MRRITLSDAVTRDRFGHNRLPDTLKLKLGLERLGYYQSGTRGFSPGPDDSLWHGLEAYQRDHDLEVDGIALPNGPTMTALNADLDRAPTASSLFRGRFDAPLSYEQVNSNRRTAHALARSDAAGDLPTFMVSALMSGSPTAPAEIADLLVQSHERAPAQAGRLRVALEDYLDDDDLGRLDTEVRNRAGSGWDETTAEARAERNTREATRSASADNADDDGDAGSTQDQRENFETTAGPSKDDERFDRFRENLRPREGGFSDRPSDSGGPTDKGISSKFLQRFNAKHPGKGLPDDPRQLTEEQKTQLFREEFYDGPQIGKLADVPGLEEAAPQLAEQMFDAGVLHGPKNAGIWLQQSLDEQLGTDLRTKSRDGSLAYDGAVGSQTRKAVEQAVNAGKIGAVNNAMVDRRTAFMRGLPKFPDNPGWIPRAQSFRR